MMSQRHFTNRISNTLSWGVLLLFSFLNLQTLYSQKEMQIHPGQTTMCPKGEEVTHGKHTGSKSAKSAVVSRSKEKTAIFEITFGPGAIENPEVMAAYQFAVDIWATEIVSEVPIRIFADYTPIGAGFIGGARSAYFVSNFPNSPVADRRYPAALANALSGSILNPDERFEILINLSSTAGFYLGTDGNTPSPQFDFVTTALHEIGHGLGFDFGNAFSGSNGEGRFIGDLPRVTDDFLYSNGTKLSDVASPSIMLGEFFTSNDLFFNGKYAKAALGNTLPKLYAPAEYVRGSSVGHWDSDTFPFGNPNSLMNHSGNPGESIFDIGDITRGFLKDIGWELNDSSVFPIMVKDGDFGKEIDKGSVLETAITVSNVSGEEFILNTTFNNAINGALVLDTVEPVKLAVGETKIIPLRLNTEDLDKGDYESEVIFDTTISGAVFVSPIRFTVIDGTEVAVMETVDSITQEIDKDTTEKTASFEVTNSGDQALEYTIEVENSDVPFISIESTTGVIEKNTTGAIDYTINTPSEIGVYTATIKIRSNASNVDEVSIPVTLTVINEIAPNIFSDTVIPEVFFDVDNTSGRIRKVFVEVELSNIGELPLEYEIIQKFNGNGDHPVLIEPSANADRSGVLQSGESAFVNVELGLRRISLDDAYNIVIEFTSNDPDTPILEIPVTVTVSNKRGQFSLPEDATFGNVDLEDRMTKTFDFVNRGLASARVDNVLPNYTSVEVVEWNTTSGDNMVAVGETLSVTLSFQPNRLDVFRNMIRIISTAASPNNNSDYDIIGVGMNQLSFDGDEFKVLTNPFVTSRPIPTIVRNLKNNGESVVDYEMVLPSTNTTVTVDTVKGTLQPGESIPVTITFDVTNITEAGTYITPLTVNYSNASFSNAFDVDVVLEITDEKGKFLEISKEFDGFENEIFGLVELINEGIVPIEIYGFTTDVETEFYDISARTNDQDFLGQTIVLQPNESLFIDFFMIVQSPGLVTGNVFVESNAVNNLFTIPFSVDMAPVDPEVIAFQLIDTATNEVIEIFFRDDTIDLADYDSVAITALRGVGEPGSVVFGYDDNPTFRTENIAPYALAGDFNGKLIPFDLTLGKHTITATPYEAGNGKGTEFIGKTIELEVINSELPAITDFVLINAETNEELRSIKEGDSIDLNDYNSNEFNIVAITDDKAIRHVVFGYNDTKYFRLERAEPYSLGGDVSGDYLPLALTNGTNVVTATPYTSNIGVNGLLEQGNPRTISFEVVGGAAAKNSRIDGKSAAEFVVSPNPVSDLARFSLPVVKSNQISSRLVNLLGQELDITQRISFDSGSHGSLDMSDLQQGNYFLFITDLESGVVYTAKLFKK